MIQNVLIQMFVCCSMQIVFGLLLLTQHVFMSKVSLTALEDCLGPLTTSTGCKSAKLQSAFAAKHYAPNGSMIIMKWLFFTLNVCRWKCLSRRMFDCLAASALPRYMCNIVQKETEANKWTIVSSEINANEPLTFKNLIIEHRSLRFY